jgi:hypothetical protein
MKLAFITQGKLYYRDGDSAPRVIDSPFARDIVQRALARQQKNSWKTGGSSAAAMMARQSMFDGASSQVIKVDITAVAPGDAPGELIYAITSDAVGGLFSYDLQAQTEKRLFHKENMLLSDFSKHPSKDVIACCQKMPAGNATISLRQGNDISQVTEGDSCDEAPSWVENNAQQLVYQSAGIARNQAGMMMGFGPVSIQRLDLGTGTVTPLLEDGSNDYLSPHATKNGDLFYIKRPYEPPFKRNYPAGKMFLDAVLFPFRLVRAFFDFLNAFSMLFSKKPLTTAGGPKMQGPDEKSLFLRGRLIDAQEALEKNSAEDAALHLVPRTWQLIRRDKDGGENVICSGVLSYDLAKDGQIIYSTGAAVFQCDPDGGNRQLLCKEKFVDTILMLD